MSLLNRIIVVLGVGLLSSCSLFQGGGQTCPAYTSNEEKQVEKQEKTIVLDTQKEATPKS